MRTLLLASLLLWVSGCASDPHVILTTADNKYVRQFDQAYGSVTAGGDDVIVLGTKRPACDGGAGYVHVLRIRTLWHPVNGAKPNSPAATNAALHYFVTFPPDGSYIHYAGTGFVTVEHNVSGTKVNIQAARLTRVESHGSINDPLKTFTIGGEFTAVNDKQKVDALLAELSRTVPKNIASPATSPAPQISLP